MELIPATAFGYNGKPSSLKTTINWIGEWHFKHYNKNGKLIWEDIAVNALAQEGGQSVKHCLPEKGAGYAGYPATFRSLSLEFNS